MTTLQFRIKQGENIYTAAANTAEICTDCNNNGGKNCLRYLCQHKYEPVGDQAKRACTAKDGMNTDLETIAVGMHNYYRRLVATGWAKDKIDGYAPTAKDMFAMYSECKAGDTLAEETKTIVTGCPSTPTQGNQGRSLNYYYVSKYDIPREQLLQQAITSWANEVTGYGVGKENIFDPNGQVTKYANMVHNKVENFACAVEICKKQETQQWHVNTIATFRRPIDGDPIYEIGKPCKCTNNRECSKLQGLCVLLP
ncbi:hypothetical protein Aduo_000413 [Ancylostoma duodenale]